MLIETKDHTVTCPAQNWQRIPIITCTGTPTSRECHHYSGNGGKGGTHIVCHHPIPPGGLNVEAKPEAPYPRWSARIGVRLSQEELDRLDFLANHTGNDRSHIIRTALRLHLDEQHILSDKRAKE